MAFDYESETRRPCQDDAVAADYHEAFAQARGWRGLGFPAVADHAVVSYGVETGFHALRRRLRGRLFGGGTEWLCYAPLREILGEVGERFEVLERAWIMPWLSQEMVFLLRPKRRA